MAHRRDGALDALDRPFQRMLVCESGEPLGMRGAKR